MNRLYQHQNSGNVGDVLMVMFVTFYCTKRGRGRRFCNKPTGHTGRHRYAPLVSS